MGIGLLYWLFLAITVAAQCSEVKQPLAMDDVCDDVEIVKDVLSYECLQLCLTRDWCTHYVWRPEGTCYLKKKKKLNNNFLRVLCSNSCSSFMRNNSCCCVLRMICFIWIFLYRDFVTTFI